MRTRRPIQIRLKGLFLVLAFLTFGLLANAQLKVGDNPTNIQKSSILELESTRQGLLLPRLADTAAINLLAPPDGMIIFLNTDKSLRLRSQGHWKKIADLSEATANWSLTGNAGTDPSKHFIGTVDGQPLVIRTNNNEQLRIDAAGNVGIGTNNPTAKLDVNGSVKFPALDPGANNELEVLVVGPDGSVHKRTMSSTAFENAIKAINGLQKQSLTITADAATGIDAPTIENRAVDSTIAIHLPVQDGTSATKPYGFLTKGDWDKIQSAVQEITIGAVATTDNANGASINVNGTSREIILHAASATSPGIVTTGDQTFAGNKTFTGSTTVNGNSTVVGNSTVNGNATIDGTLTVGNVVNNDVSDSVLVVNNGVLERRKVSPAAFGNAIRSINGNTEEDQTIAFTKEGTDLTVSTATNNTINLNVPDAALGARGVVTTTTQSFGGAKNFRDSVTAATTMAVGSNTYANSTMQVAGSLSMAIKTVTANYTLTDADNTLLVNPATAGTKITLPDPTNMAGRIYTIKKIGGGLDKEMVIEPTSGSIEGGTSYTIYNDWTFVTLQTDGTNWYIIKK